ncbi:MAG: YraN family protein [Clostridia bacterium]|nr:YraN family protein [Clostridia bacterium]
MPDSPQDIHKKVLGRKGEQLVEAYLKKQGCTILKRNYRTPFGEADLIVQDGDEIAFVEVKTRESFAFGMPAEAVNKRKQERYRKIAQFYWIRAGEEPNARFDVAEVYPDGQISYFKYAF